MKKFLTWMTVLTLLLTGAALAENAPVPRFSTIGNNQTENGETAETEETSVPDGTSETAGTEETAVLPDAPETNEPAVEYAAPEGKRAYQYMLQLYERVGFMIADWKFTETVQAVNAAERSVRIPASEGNVMLDVQYVLRVQGNTIVTLGEITCSIVDGTGRKYESSMWVEASQNEISEQSVKHKTADTNSHENAYLIPTDGLEVKVKNNINLEGYILFDCIAEIPAATAGSDIPLYIVIHNMGETDYYVRIQ